MPPIAPTTLAELAKSVKLIVTHMAIFHADDVCAIAWLRLCGCIAPVERRNPTPEELADPTVAVIDVGRQYDKSLMNFDHHQYGKNPSTGKWDLCRWETDMPYASFGIVLEHFWPGTRIDGEDSGFVMEALMFDKMVATQVDALDNGYRLSEPTATTLSLSQAIAWLNPTGDNVTPEQRDEAFDNAVGIAMDILRGAWDNACYTMEGYRVVEEGELVHPEVLVLPRYAPWTPAVLGNEDYDNVKFVVYPSLRGGFNVQQVPVEAGSMEGRSNLPEHWRKKTQAELAEITGIHDITFVHANGFVGNAESRSSAIAMAGAALDHQAATA